MRIENTKVITDGSMTGTAVINSDAIWLGHICNWAIQIDWARLTGALTGAYKVQVSNADAATAPSSGKMVPTSDAVWSDLTGATGSVADAASGNALLNFTDAGYQWARLVYTNATGTGTLQARVNGKGF